MNGLGAADAKAGIAVILMTVKIILREVQTLKGDLLVLSLLGKETANRGTLAAFEGL